MRQWWHRPAWALPGPQGAEGRLGGKRLFKLALPFAIVVVLGVLGWFAAEHQITQAHRRSEREAGARVLSDVEALEQNLLRTIEAVEGIHSLAQTRQNLLQRDSAEGVAAIEDHLKAVATQERFGILQISIADAGGTLIWSSVPNWAPISIADREHFQTHKAGRTEMFVSAPVLGRASGKWSIQLTRPIWGEDGAFAGIAVVSLDPLLLSARLGAIHFEPNQTAAVLLLPEGTMIARSRAVQQVLGQMIRPSHPVLAAASAATRGYLRTSSLLDDGEVVMAFHRVAETSLLVLVSEDWAVSKASLDELQRWIRGVYAAASLLSFAALVALIQVRIARRTREDLKLAQAARNAAEAVREEFARILLGSPAVIYAGERQPDDKDPHKPARVRFVSSNAARVTGWDASALMEPNAFVDRMDDVGRAERARFRAANMQVGGGSMTYRFRQPDGSWMWLREEARVAGTTAEGMLLIIGYLTDITSQRQLEAQAAASARLATLGEMAAGIAHEMNQPLAIIALAAENAANDLRLEGAAAIPDALTRLERIIRQAGRGGAIVHHLREFSRPGSVDEAGPTQLGEVLDMAQQLTRGAMSNAGVEWVQDLPADLPAISAGLVAAEQVFVNLILNACDAMLGQPQEQPRRILVRGRVEAELILVTVTDTGGGISAANVDKVFEPFFTTKPPDKGTGLGLSICHGIMRSLGGSIAVANVPGGAEFLLRFRRADGVGSDPASTADVKARAR